MLTRRALILAKEETTYGTDASPAPGTNAILAYDPVITPQGDKLERRPPIVTLSPMGPVLGARFAELTFTTELRASGTLGTAPRIGDLLEACGFAETINAGVNVEYEPASSGLKSASIYAYFDGLLHKILGAVGTLELIAEAGQLAKINWTFRGLYSKPTDTALPAAGSITYDAEIPPVVKSANFTFDGSSVFAVQAVNIVLNNDIAERRDVSAATGIKGFVIAGRAPTGSFNPEAILLATYDLWALWEAATQKALSITIGDTATNKVIITAPKVSLDQISHADRDGVRAHDIPISLGMNSGDDELKFDFQ